MKRSQLQQIIKEEIQKVLQEYTARNFDIQRELQGRENGKPVDMAFFKEFLPKTAATVSSAIQGAKELKGKNVDAHSMVHYVRDNATNKVYYLGHTQYYVYRRPLNQYDKPNNSGPNIALLVIREMPEGIKGASDIPNAAVYTPGQFAVVDTRTYLDELKSKPQLDILKTVS